MRWLIQSQICFWPVTGSSLLRNTPQILQNRLATYVLIAVKVFCIRNKLPGEHLESGVFRPLGLKP